MSVGGGSHSLWRRIVQLVALWLQPSFSDCPCESTHGSARRALTQNRYLPPTAPKQSFPTRLPLPRLSRILLSGTQRYISFALIDLFFSIRRVEYLKNSIFMRPSSVKNDQQGIRARRGRLQGSVLPYGCGGGTVTDSRRRIPEIFHTPGGMTDRAEKVNAYEICQAGSDGRSRTDLNIKSYIKGA
jgi:hypothetical protein